MTTQTDIFTALSVYCDLQNRELHAGIPLPHSIQPRPHMFIGSVELFVSTNLLRMDQGSRGVAALAQANLEALINYIQKKETK